MNRKIYVAPQAELVLFAPSEELAASWNWGGFNNTTNASIGTTKEVTIWQNPFDFTQSDDSYKIND